MVQAYWQIGKMIVEKQGREDRAKYGEGLIYELSIQMTKDFGRGFNKRSLEQMRKFYLLFQKPNAVRAELSWSYYILFPNRQRAAWRIELDTLQTFQKGDTVWHQFI